MDYVALKAEIIAKCSQALVASRNEAAIAEVVSAGRTKVESKLIGIGTILAALPGSGGAFLDGLVALGQTNRDVYWAMELIKAGTLDIGMQATIDQVTALAAANPSIAPAVSTLLALAVVLAPVSPYDVERALEAI